MGFYSDIQLTEQETLDAIEQAKIKKYFLLRNAPYWEQQQNLAGLNHEEEKRLNRIKSAQLKRLGFSTSQKGSKRGNRRTQSPFHP